MHIPGGRWYDIRYTLACIRSIFFALFTGANRFVAQFIVEQLSQLFDALDQL